ncbi:MAG: hypothetical protein EAX91_17275 [Candidatus Lokiarchaeota archaeon]|nr:hypothetical protein [Candidatus Lokiarchaeota archaeon]
MKPSKVKLGLFYLTLSSIIFGVSFISSSFIWFNGGMFGLSSYYLPLSFPLDMSLEVSPLAIYPPIITMRLDIFGIDIINIYGQYSIHRLTETIIIVEGITLIFTSVIFLINITFVFLCLLIMYIVDKRRIGKDFIKYSRRVKPSKTGYRNTFLICL